MSQHVPDLVDPHEPFTQIAIPLLDRDLIKIYVNSAQHFPFLGYVALSILFRQLIEGTLPDQSNGIVLVV